MKILVIIVTYNAMQWVERCFDSLRNSSVRPDVFVVDNGSTDGTQAYIQEHYPEVMFHQSKENLGFGKANNLGLQYALDEDYDFVYLLNQDAWIFEDTLKKLIEISKRHLEYGVLSPFQMEANMKHIDKNFKRFVCARESSQNLIDDLYLGVVKDVIKVEIVMAAHWLITKQCLHKVGGFSPTFPHYGEDINYLDRLRFHGLDVGVVPSLRVVHDRENRKSTKEKNIYMSYISALRYLSNPSVNTNLPLLYMLVRPIIKYKSLNPMLNIYKIIKSYSAIVRNRKESMNMSHAFLRY